jgi:hypothetical protein
MVATTWASGFIDGLEPYDVSYYSVKDLDRADALFVSKTLPATCSDMCVLPAPFCCQPVRRSVWRAGPGSG